MMNFLLKIIDFIMPKRWYIEHTEYVTFRYGPALVDRNYFGPFAGYEIENRLEDEYAELLRYGGDDVDAVQLSWSKVRRIPFIASGGFWEEQNDALYDDEPPIWRDQ